MDIEGDVEIVDFAGNAVSQKDFAFKQYQARATPALAFFDLDGKLVTRYTGATRDATELLWLGEYVVDKAYERTPFARYKRDKKQAQGQR